jgi:hypothetical protein
VGACAYCRGSYVLLSRPRRLRTEWVKNLVAPDQATNVLRVRAYFAARREAEALLTAAAASYASTPEGGW